MARREFRARATEDFQLLSDLISLEEGGARRLGLLKKMEVIVLHDTLLSTNNNNNNNNKITLCRSAHCFQVQVSGFFPTVLRAGQGPVIPSILKIRKQVLSESC